MKLVDVFWLILTLGYIGLNLFIVLALLKLSALILTGAWP